MLARIQQIMEDKGLNLSAFSDEIGVKRTTMTHTMSGRNNPSLDIVSKILERYTDISPDWLIFGRGLKNKSTTPVQQALFTELPTVEKMNDALPKANLEIATPATHPTAPPTSMQMEHRLTENEKKIDRIMIFYSDNSFETFIPENEKKK